jgi:hypothetical protein
VAFNEVPREWQAPKHDTAESYKLGWINETCQQGHRWQEAQRGFSDWRQAFDQISGYVSRHDVADYRSRISGHRLKTNIRVMTSGLADVRPMWGYCAQPPWASQALALNKTAWALHIENHWSMKIADWLQWAAATCTGWLRPVYRRDMQGHGTLDLDAFGMPSLLFTQIPHDGDFNRAYTATLLEEVPIYEAHWKFPMYQDRLKPTASRYWYSTNIRAASTKNAIDRMWTWFARRDEGDGLRDEFVPIRWTYINDASINDTGQVVAMGDPGSSWYYEVPYYGQNIPDGVGNMRKANELDCRLYPQRRLMISSQDCVMYDGPGFDWHGQLPFLALSLDKWPWEPMGLNLCHDGAELQLALDRIDRGAMDKINALQDLPLGYPIDGVTLQQAEGFDPMRPRGRIGFDAQQVDQPFKEAVPMEVYKIHAETIEMRKIYQDELDYIFQTRDVMELAKARALGKGMDQLEALIASYGPIVKDLTLRIEKALSCVGTQVGWLILQYMTTARLMQYAGTDAVELSTFDYNPASIVPSHLPGEPIHTDDQMPRASQYTPAQRARWFASNVKFLIQPHSAHELSQTTVKLGLLQLKQRGAPISWHTIEKSFEVPNVGNVDGNTETEKYRAETEDEIRFKARMAVIVKDLGAEMGLADQMSGAGKPNGSTQKGGRPPTAQAPPQQKQKGDGRVVMSESS